MRTSSLSPPSRPLCLGLALTLAAIVQATASAQAPPPAPAVRVVTLSLPQCLHAAMLRQPRIAAQRASLAAAEDGLRALESLQTPALLVPELPVRRRQAALGVAAATAAVDQAERETVFAVTRAYFTVLYAREQERIARAIVERLGATRDTAKRAIDAGARDVSAADVQRSTVYLRLAEAKRIQATQGVQRALAALREAIGLGPECRLDVPAGRLPDPTARPVRDEVVAQAVARRAELVRAGLLSEVTGLEVKAQEAGLHRRMETFAAGGDIHASTVAGGTQGEEYRPGALAPEMPTTLAGTRPERMKRAQSLHIRSQAVAEITRNLIALEAEDAFLRWEEAAQQVPAAREAAQTGDALANDLSKDFASGLKIKVEDVITARVLASQARAQYHEYLYRQLVALAELERITGGAFCAGLVEPPAPFAKAARPR